MLRQIRRIVAITWLIVGILWLFVGTRAALQVPQPNLFQAIIAGGLPFILGSVTVISAILFVRGREWARRMLLVICAYFIVMIGFAAYTTPAIYAQLRATPPVSVWGTYFALAALVVLMSFALHMCRPLRKQM